MPAILADQLTSWYNRINGIRGKSGISLGSISVPSVKNQPAKAQHYSDTVTQITNLYSNIYLSFADKSAPMSNATAGTLIDEDQKINLEKRLTELEKICANFIVNGTTSG